MTIVSDMSSGTGSAVLSLKEQELLIAILKSTGAAKPSWVAIQEKGMLPEGVTPARAACM